MTRLLTIDPGKNTGIALGFYDAITPYRLIERWQVHEGTHGFIHWWDEDRPEYDELVVEKFILDSKNEFSADLTPVEIEGALKALIANDEVQPVFQLRSAKGDLTPYPPEAKTKAQRQRVRFNFLDRFGFFKKGADNDDSNDAICHGLIYLKRRKHMPSLLAFWPPRKPIA